MSNALDQYRQARRQALACVTEKKAKDQNPYLPVLDHYLHTLRQVRKQDLGLREILTDRIVGTCHEGRTESFAANFMPLLEDDTEFASKWMTLCTYATGEGLRDPIKVYMLFGRFFVEEGNKRVSVTKFLKNPLISARVIEIEVDPYDLPDGELYRKFLKFFSMTGISSILMSKSKNYTKLLRIVCDGKDEPLSEEERKDLRSLFYSFESVFHKLIHHPIEATTGDAFLMYLEAFGWHRGEVIPDSVQEKELASILPAVLAYPHAHKAALLTDTDSSERRTVFSFFKDPVHAALIEIGDPDTSSWSRVHNEAFQTMEREMDGLVRTKVYSNCNTQEKAEAALKQAIADGAQVIFTAHPLLLQLTNQFAAKHPKVRFLNCSLNPEASLVRTYYTRGYEIQFLQGMAAGALTTSGRIGYVADYPIFGAIADINAFAIGVSMVRPDASVYLEWSTTEYATNRDFPTDIDMIYIAGQDFDTRIAAGKRFGLFDVRTGKFTNLSTTHQKWDVFYTRILNSILNRTYKADEASANGASINYWLGLSNGLIDVSFSSQMPFQTRRLIRQIKDDMADRRFFVFDGIHVKHKDEERTVPISLEEIATMDWLVDNIVGTVPVEAQMIPSAEKLVQLHGVENREDRAIDEVQMPGNVQRRKIKPAQETEEDEEDTASSSSQDRQLHGDSAQAGAARRSERMEEGILNESEKRKNSSSL